MAITNSSSDAVPPTTQAYHEVQLAHEFLNADLFDGKLPPCLITFQRKGSSTAGFYCANRFVTATGRSTDEIALNPRFFQTASFDEVMSTLAHEMVHEWQQHFGRKRSRAAYHNKEWAGEMLRIGLRPTTTGGPEGKMTAQSVSHLIIPGGRFALAVQKLRAMVPALTWHDAHPAERMPQGLAGSELVGKGGLSGRRTVYRCPKCKDHAEGKSTLFLICGKCDLHMQPNGLR